MKEFIAIVPARAGSKGIKNKNIQKIGSKPMICHTFDAANKSKFIKDTFITTDDEKIIKFAKRNKINVPFSRPKSLSEDTSSTLDVILHFFNWYKKEHKRLPKNFVLLQPTSPLRDSIDIDNAIDLFIKQKRDTLISASEVLQHPHEMFHIDKNNSKLEFFYQPENITSATMRQMYKETYFENGAIYICNTKWFLKNLKFLSENSGVYIQSQENSIDIDTQFDLEMARFIYKNRKKRK